MSAPKHRISKMISGRGLVMHDISAATFGKYQHCGMARNGLWYASQDLDANMKPRRGALPAPQQDSQELCARALQIHNRHADRLVRRTFWRLRRRRWAEKIRAAWALIRRAR